MRYYGLVFTADLYKYGFLVQLVDTMNCVQLYHHQIRGLDFVRCRIDHSHSIKTSPLPQGFNYRSVCDI